MSNIIFPTSQYDPLSQKKSKHDSTFCLFIRYSFHFILCKTKYAGLTEICTIIEGRFVEFMPRRNNLRFLHVSNTSNAVRCVFDVPKERKLN